LDEQTSFLLHFKNKNLNIAEIYNSCYAFPERGTWSIKNVVEIFLNIARQSGHTYQ
jgi:hypothetical protein